MSRSDVVEGEVQLVPVREEDKSVLANLLQLYRYDFSTIRGYELTGHGTYVYRYLDAYFLEPTRSAFLIRHEGELAGFVMIRTRPDGVHEMAELFVVRLHRRRGVGRAAARRAFATRSGRWEVSFDTANTEAAAFWPGVVEGVAVGPVEPQQKGPPEHVYEGTVLRLSTE